MSVHHDEPLSSVLQSVLDVGKNRPISVGELMSRVAERGFGLSLVMLALPTLFPVLPPGSAATIGFLYIIIGFQMLIGRPYPWLPPQVKNYQLSEKITLKLRTRGVSFFRTLERFSSSRWLFMERKVILRLIAIIIILMGVILFTPLPFMNTLPAFAVMLLGAGLLNRDGIFLLAGMMLSFGLLGFIYFGLDAILGTVNIFRY